MLLAGRTILRLPQSTHPEKEILLRLCYGRLTKALIVGIADLPRQLFAGKDDSSGYLK
jgi:hypothetical protein